MKATFHFVGPQSEIFLGLPKEQTDRLQHALGDGATVELGVMSRGGLGKSAKKIINMKNVLFVTIEEE